MKIAIAICEDNFNSPLAEYFGLSKYFLILDSKTKTQKIINNPFSESFGGSGIQSSQLLIENNCDILITKMIESQLLVFLNSAEIKVYKSDEDSVSKSIKLYFDGNLNQINFLFANEIKRK